MLQHTHGKPIQPDPENPVLMPTHRIRGQNFIYNVSMVWDKSGGNIGGEFCLWFSTGDTHNPLERILRMHLFKLMNLHALTGVDIASTAYVEGLNQAFAMHPQMLEDYKNVAFSPGADGTNDVLYGMRYLSTDPDVHTHPQLEHIKQYGPPPHVMPARPSCPTCHQYREFPGEERLPTEVAYDTVTKPIPISQIDIPGTTTVDAADAETAKQAVEKVEQAVNNIVEHQNKSLSADVPLPPVYAIVAACMKELPPEDFALIRKVDELMSGMTLKQVQRLGAITNSVIGYKGLLSRGIPADVIVSAMSEIVSQVDVCAKLDKKRKH